MNREIQLLVRFLDSIREYEHESGNSVYNDERESKEFVDIFLTTKEYQLLPKEEVGKEKQLYEALVEIAKGEGRYDMDRFKHASNTIEDMIAIARKAISEYKEPLKEGVDLVSNGTFQNDKDWNTPLIKVPKEEMDTRGTFNEWYDKNATRFHQSQFDAKEAFFNNLNTKL